MNNTENIYISVLAQFCFVFARYPVSTHVVLLVDTRY